MLPYWNYFSANQKYSKQTEGLATGAPISELFLMYIYNN
jgi:hypothetical protein